jgi:glycosyltransferase involved in cell wall biosynthesis
MRFSIITPSFRSGQWLRLCIASVADQEGVEFEHIVQDSCSDDGTQDWLPGEKRVQACIEKDQGMYDAVNRGFRRASGEVLAYLNCDEQYLPGALQAVHDFFNKHPEVDVLLADTVVTDANGDYLCHRYSLVPSENQIWVRFSVLTCALFIRRRVVHEQGLFFDTRWRDLGDFFWVLEAVRRGLRLAVLPRITSVFADTGENMNLKPNALRERKLKYEMTPGWLKRLQLPYAIQYRLRLAARGALRLKPFDYWLYTLQSPATRVRRTAARPTSFWKRGSGSLASRVWQNAWTLKNQ